MVWMPIYDRKSITNRQRNLDDCANTNLRGEVVMLQQNEPDVKLQMCEGVRKLVMLLWACFVPQGHRFKQPVSLLPLRLLFALAVDDAATAAACETAKRNAASACDRRIASA